MVRRTGFREQYYTGTSNFCSTGKIGASNPARLCVHFDRFFIDNFGLTSSFGLGPFVQRDMIILHQWKLVRCPGKSIRESYRWVKVIVYVQNDGCSSHGRSNSSCNVVVEGKGKVGVA